MGDRGARRTGGTRADWRRFLLFAGGALVFVALVYVVDRPLGALLALVYGLAFMAGLEFMVWRRWRRRHG